MEYPQGPKSALNFTTSAALTVFLNMLILETLEEEQLTFK